MPTGNEPPTQAERDEQPPPIPGKIPEEQPAQSGELISPVTPVETRYPAPLIPERNARRSVEGPPGQARPPIPAFQSQEPYGRAPSGPQDYPSPARLPSDHKPPNGLGPTKTIDNLKRAAAGVHVSRCEPPLVVGARVVTLIHRAPVIFSAELSTLRSTSVSTSPIA